MSSFSRAFAGELYLFSHRRSIRIAHIAVFVLALVFAAVNLGLLTATAYLKTAKLAELPAYSFWPQWAAATHTTMYLVELLVVMLIAGALPHEIMSAAARDPFSRRISRTSFVLARSAVALILPLTLYACALTGSALMSLILFDQGDFQGTTTDVLKGMLHAVLPLITLGAIASACGAIFKRSVLAVGASFILIISPTMFSSDFEDQLPYYFADFLPAFGHHSFLSEVAKFSAGNSGYFGYEYEDMANIGWFSPLPYLVLSVILSVLFFRRKSL